MKQKISTLFLILISFVIQGQNLVINEILSSNSTINSDENGDFEDWIELYNGTSNSINLNGYGLTDDPALPMKWTFTNITINPGQYLLVWASSKNRISPPHTNFKISATGETIILSTPSGTIIDQVPPVNLPPNVSYARSPNGSGGFIQNSTPSPGAANLVNQPLVPPPVFSHTSGFYTTNLTLSITHSDPSAIIYYTLDGSEPGPGNLSPVSYSYKNSHNMGEPYDYNIPFLTKSIVSYTYTAPLAISNRNNAPNNLPTIASTYDRYPSYFPDVVVKKGTVVRARAYVNGVGSKIISHSYFISGTNQFNQSLPVWSLSVDPSELFDWDKGIFNAAKRFEDWKVINQQEISNGASPANYNRDTGDLEKRANVQFFVNKQPVFNQNIGIRISGGWSRANCTKSIRLYAREEYDIQNTLNYSFFGPENSSSFKRLVLRNSGQDFDRTYLRDGFMNKLVQHLKFDTHDYQPSVVYVNGEYWGMLNIRERYDKHYFERVYNILETELELIENNAVVEEGSNTHFLNLRNYLYQNNLSLSSNYEYVKTQMDIENFTDYQISQIFYNNGDWPGNNVRYFRKSVSQYTPNAPHGHDGRWRWIMYDTDFGFGYGSISGHTVNSLIPATQANGPAWPNPDWSTVFLRKLLENNDFKNQFINRFADLLNTTFLSSRMSSLLESMVGVISSEIPVHGQRWRRTVTSTIYDKWTESLNIMRTFASQRPANQRSHITSFFNLSGTYTATLNVSDTSGGFIKINTLDIAPSTVGVNSNPYPWSGTYFNSVPIRLVAKAKAGYRFTHWTGSVTGTDTAVVLSPAASINATAHFEAIPVKALMHFWYMGDHLANNTPLVSINSFFSKAGLSAGILQFKSCLVGYPFTSTHPLWRKSSMERRNDPTSLNYRPEGNNNLAYNPSVTRGLQIKQAFTNQGNNNELHFSIPTLGYKNIDLSFAVRNDLSTVDSIIIEYLNPDCNVWTNNGIQGGRIKISDIYNVFYCSFSNISVANNNPDFKVRILFKGNNLETDLGNRVTFNNIAIEGDIMNTCSTVVTNQMDSGSGSLRNALECVQNGGVITFSTVDTIRFSSPVTFYKNVTLSNTNSTPIVFKYDFANSEFQNCGQSLSVTNGSNVTFQNLHFYHLNNNLMMPFLINKGNINFQNSRISGTTKSLVQNESGATINFSGTSYIK